MSLGTGTRRKALVVTAAILLAAMLVASSAHAVPVLQLYIPGAIYDGSSWIVETSTFQLWVIGNVGSVGTIADVKLAAAVDPSVSGSVTLTALSGTPDPTVLVDDPSTTYQQVPLFGDDSTQIPSHGIYGPSTTNGYYEWLLGNMLSTDPLVPIQDMVEGGTSRGLLFAYEVTITGYTDVHFDTYDHYMGESGVVYKINPLSHDAEAVPEPAALMLLGVGLTFIGVIARTRKKLNC